MKVSDTQKTITCIIVDDEKDARDRLSSLLAKIEHVNVIANEGNPETAIKTIVDEQPDLVLIDVEMPRKSGFDIITEVRNENVNSTFIFVTAYNQYAIKAIKNRAFDYILKPVDIDELKEALERFNRSLKEKQKQDIPKILAKEYFLTPREIEIMEFLLECKTSKEIAEILFISKNTVDTHRRKILEKTETKSTAELVYLLFNSN